MWFGVCAYKFFLYYFCIWSISNKKNCSISICSHYSVIHDLVCVFTGGIESGIVVCSHLLLRFRCRLAAKSGCCNPEALARNEIVRPGDTGTIYQAFASSTTSLSFPWLYRSATKRRESGPFQNQFWLHARRPLNPGIVRAPLISSFLLPRATVPRHSSTHPLPTGRFFQYNWRIWTARDHCRLYSLIYVLIRISNFTFPLINHQIVLARNVQ